MLVSRLGERKKNHFFSFFLCFFSLPPYRDRDYENKASFFFFNGIDKKQLQSDKGGYCVCYKKVCVINWGLMSFENRFDGECRFGRE